MTKRDALTLYRGTQAPEVKGVREALSYTPSLPVAIIWSSHPGDEWGREGPHFLPGSTVHTAKLNTNKTLELSEYPHTTFESILKKLRYGKRGGIANDEAVKILTYLHHRLIGRAKGGEFKYIVLDAEGEPEDPWDVPLSFATPITLISRLRDDFEYADSSEEALELAGRLEADTFIFADAPAVKRAALKMGYEVLWYPDVFEGGEYAVPKLLGMNVGDLQGVSMDYDIEDEEIPTHDTWRPLIADAIVTVESVRAQELLERMDLAELRK